jgi:predicted alpha/beta hydrolase
MATLDLERWLDVVLGEDTLNAPEVAVEEATVPARDGRALAATLVRPVGPARAAVLVASGLGIPRRYYRGFASHLATQGVATLLVDYRGIGGSARGPLRSEAATLQDWGRLDLSGAFAWLGERYPRLPRSVVAHSVAGQLLGLMDNAGEIRRVVSVGAALGDWRRLLAPSRQLAWLMWHAVVPSVTRVTGYLPASRVGLGEDLPGGVARQWAERGRRPAAEVAALADGGHFDELRAPWLAVLATDDRVAVGPNARPLYALYPHADVALEWLVPVQEGVERIGHLGFFARANARLWQRASTFLSLDAPADQASPRPSQAPGRRGRVAA